MKIIAGVDEAGRGALAGPVVASAVILPEEYDLDGLNDSKKVSPPKREVLFDKITSQAISIGVGIVPAIEIDRINILESTYKAMKMSLGKLNPVPEEALIDGFPLNRRLKPIIAWYGNMPLIGHLKCLLDLISISVNVKFLNPINAKDFKNRKSMTFQLQNAINKHYSENY